ncbi:hypothetical protein Tco_1231865 [Tanacetum coccineum]
MSNNKQTACEDDVSDQQNSQNKYKNKDMEKKEKKPSGYGRRAKRVVLTRIKTAKKFRIRSLGSSGGRCCLRIKKRLESCAESPTSDPNSSEFSFDSLKSLIENNDFYLNECNTHLDDHFVDCKSECSSRIDFCSSVYSSVMSLSAVSAFHESI